MKDRLCRVHQQPLHPFEGPLNPLGWNILQEVWPFFVHLRLCSPSLLREHLKTLDSEPSFFPLWLSDLSGILSVLVFLCVSEGK